MKLKVFFVGQDQKYWKRLQNLYQKTYPSWEFKFQQEAFEQSSCFKTLFKRLYQSKPDIIYIDGSKLTDQALGLGKLLVKNEELRLCSVVALFSNDTSHLMDRAISASIRLNHIKSGEIEDVIYDPISLINVEIAEPTDFVWSRAMDDFEVYQPLRIGFIAENHFHIETNSYLPLNEILEVSEHPLAELMPSKKVFVQKFYQHDLYFNKRFGYDLEFIFIDNDFFTRTNDRWLMYKKLKQNPKLVNQLSSTDKKEIEQDMQVRKQRFLPIKNKIKSWINERKINREPKKLKILVVDEDLRLFHDLDRLKDDFVYSINFQTYLGENSHVIERFTPHLIAFHFGGERNNEADFERVIDRIQKISDYDPIIIAFGLSPSQQAFVDEIKTVRIIGYTQDIEPQLLLSLAQKMDNKLHITDWDQKVFLRSSDETSCIYIKRNIKVVSMNESILFFESEVEIPLWTIFKVTHPIPFFITVVPHRDGSQYAENKKIYRALINGTNEEVKTKLRRMINQTLSPI